MKHRITRPRAFGGDAVKLMRRGTHAHKALLVLGLAGGELDRRGLLRRSGLSKLAVNSAIHTLHRYGFIRVRSVALTDKGKDALELLALLSGKLEVRP